MSLSDPIADILTRIRNAQHAGHESVEIGISKSIENIAKILKSEGFIADYKVQIDGPKKKATVQLKYYQGEPVIRGLQRVSKPGRRVYNQWKEIRPFMNSIGVGIYSTPKGIVTDKEAMKLHVGGEYICKVW